MSNPAYPIPPAGTLWLDASRFNDIGGWTVDDQFIDHIGSPVLLAIGYGRPVAPAKTRLPGGIDGEYRVWVRSRDWVPEHHPGTFRLRIAGVEMPMVFGASGRDGWVWEDAGVHRISGDSLVELVDLTGYYGRCDAIALCPGHDWRPPDGVEDLCRIRIALGLWSKEVGEEGPQDVVVVGGGLAGCLAAIAAARGGARTVLLHNRSEFGGNASTENLVPPVGAMQNLIDPEDHDLDPRETGLLEELGIPARQRYVEVGKDYPSRLWHLAQGEPHLSLRMGFHVSGVETDASGRILAVTGIDVKTGGRHRYAGSLFIDATGDGLVGLRAGAHHAMGREGRSVYGESKAPEAGNRDTLGSSIKYWCDLAGEDMPFASPAWAYPFDSCDKIHKDKHPSAPGFIDRQWVVELGGEGNSHAEAEDVRDRLLRLVYGLYDHMKNHCPKGDVPPGRLRLAWVGHVVARRESYRLLGDHVLTEQDVVGQTVFHDAVAYGGWGLDDHPTDGFFSKHLNDHTHGGIFFSVPYRSLYSRNIPNLFLAGRNISASHVAFSATRVMRTTAVMGQAVGTAAAQCLRGGRVPRDLSGEGVKELQQKLLKDGAFIIGVRNEDPDDHARVAHVWAYRSPETAATVVSGHDRAQFPCHFRGAIRDLRAWVPGMDGGELELSWADAVRMNGVHLVFQGTARCPESVTLQVEGRAGWEDVLTVSAPRLQRRTVLTFDERTTRKLRFVFPAGVKPWGLCQVRVYREAPTEIEAIRRGERTRSAWPPPARLPWEFQGT